MVDLIDLSDLAPSTLADIRSLAESAVAGIQNQDTVNVERILERLLDVLNENKDEISMPPGSLEYLSSVFNEVGDDPGPAEELLELLLDNLV